MVARKVEEGVNAVMLRMRLCRVVVGVVEEVEKRMN